MEPTVIALRYPQGAPTGVIDAPLPASSGVRDGSIAFYSRMRNVLKPSMTILDFGAGRGEWMERPQGLRLRNFKGQVAKVIGVDPDPDVLNNPSLDEAHVLATGCPLPLADASVDLILADWVVEHLADPQGAVCELHRVLRPGGYLFARTTNRNGYVPIAARLTPKRWHPFVLRYMQPDRKGQDVFETFYRCNTIEAVHRTFPPGQWVGSIMPFTPDPGYTGNSLLLFKVMSLFHRILPDTMASNLFVTMVKIG